MIYLKYCSVDIIDSEKNSSIVFFFVAEKLTISPIKGCTVALIYPYEWNSYMTPWEYDGDKIGKDTGKGKWFAKVCIDEVFPEVIKQTGHTFSRQMIGGYSLGGLMAMFMAYEYNLFSAAASVSGSLWYPKAMDYFKQMPIPKQTSFFYFMLGKKEKLTSDKERSLVENNTNELFEHIKKARNTVFELVPGNHFTDVAGRIEKSVRALNMN